MVLFKDDLNRTAVMIAKVKDLLGQLEDRIQNYPYRDNFLDYGEFDEDILGIAYAIRVGILDRIDKNKWSLMHPISIPTGLFGVNNTNIINSLEMTAGRLKNLVKSSPAMLFVVEDILTRGEYFEKYDRMIPNDTKSAL